MSEPAVELLGLTKRFRGSGPLVPLPHRFGASRLERGAARRDEERVDPEDDELSEDDELDDEPRPQEGRDIWALRDVTLRIDAGTALGIIGRNGSGKTTLLRILGKTAVPTGGRAVVRGRLAPLLHTVPGLMLQRESGLKNVEHVAGFLGIPRDEAAQRAEVIADFSEMRSRMRDHVRTYSTGELQRFAFAIMLGLEPKVILADEIVAVGDAWFRDRCMERLEELVGEGATLLLASHDMRLVRRLCTEVVLMDGGRVAARGPTPEIVELYERSAAPVGARADGGAADFVAGVGRGPVDRVGVYTATGQRTDLLSFDEEAMVEIAIDVEDAPVTLRCALTLSSPGAQLRSTQPHFVASAPGRYYVSARIHPRTLHDGSFRGRIAVIAYTDGGRKTISQINDAFGLEVFGADPRLDTERVPAFRQLDLTWGVYRA